MKSQAIIIAALMASSMVIMTIVIWYVSILPYTTTVQIKTRNYDVYSIVYSKSSWTAKELAYKLLNALQAKLVEVNITVYNITDNTKIRTDYFAIIPTGLQAGPIYNFEITRLDSSGLLYEYKIRVEYG